MNNYLNCDSDDSRRSISCCCTGLDGVICFFAFLIALAIGLILGSIFYETILPVIASVIAFAAALIAVLIALIVIRRRRSC